MTGASGDSGEAGEGEGTVKTVYRAYPRRWLVIASIMSLNMVSYCLSVSFGPVASQAAQYYGVSGDLIDLIPIVALSINMPGMFVAIYCIDRFGVKAGVRWGSSCILLGCAIRCFSTFPTYQEDIEPHTRFWLTFTGQAVTNVGHPFLITMSTKVSQVWFPDRERIWTTAAMAGAPALGAMIGSILSPIIVNDNPENIPLLNIIFPSCALLGTILAWTTITSPYPPTAPSLSAQKLREKPPLTFHQFFANMKQVLSSHTMKAFLVLMGAGIGLFNMLGTQLGQMLCATGYSSTQAGLAAATLIFTGLVGSFIVGPLARRWQCQEQMAKICYSLSSVGVILLLIFLREKDMFWAILLSLSLFGFTGLGAFPLILELAVEETFPADPVISEALIHISGQAQAIMLILLGNAAHWSPSPEMAAVEQCSKGGGGAGGGGAVQPWDYTPYYYILMAMGFLNAVAFILFINPTLRRTAVDRGEDGKN